MTTLCHKASLFQSRSANYLRNSLSSTLSALQKDLMIDCFFGKHFNVLAESEVRAAVAIVAV